MTTEMQEAKEIRYVVHPALMFILGLFLSTAIFMLKGVLENKTEQDLYYVLKESCTKVGIYNYVLDGSVNSIECKPTLSKYFITEADK